MDTVLSKDGTQIAYQRSGSGPPLVLVHGTAADHTRWANVLPALERHCTVYAMDRRGRGGSGDADEYAIQREYEDVAALVDSIGGPVNLLGHSYGALCCLNSLLLTPNIGRLILYEPPPPELEDTYPPGILARLQMMLENGDREGVVRTFMLEIPKVPPEQLELMRSAPSWAQRVAAAHTIPRESTGHPPFNPERFAAVKTPVLLLLGGDSLPLFRDFTEQVHAALAYSKIVVLPGQQHIAMNTAPDMFVREVLTFVAPSVSA